MNVSDKGAPAAAIVAALSTLACCLPLGFLSALGLASISLWARQYSRWLLVASIAFLCIGSVQLYFRKSCTKRSTASLVLFWIAVVIVILIAVFPQLIASLIAVRRDLSHMAKSKRFLGWRSYWLLPGTFSSQQ
jgi:cytochrome bd-type quinol oxidase subunit 2